MTLKTDHLALKLGAPGELYSIESPLAPLASPHMGVIVGVLTLRNWPWRWPILKTHGDITLFLQVQSKVHRLFGVPRLHSPW